MGNIGMKKFKFLLLQKQQEFEDPIKQHGQYWDEKIQIPIVAKTNSGKIVAGFCKFSDSKIKKSELNKFLDELKSENISADIIVIFAKGGFSSELKNLKNENLKLFSVKSLKALVQQNLGFLLS